jgi:hypothetical protein
MWNVLENGYLDPHAMTRIDFNKERGRVSYNQFPATTQWVESRSKGPKKSKTSRIFQVQFTIPSQKSP